MTTLHTEDYHTSHLSYSHATQKQKHIEEQNKFTLAYAVFYNCQAGRKEPY
jgi:hypothetical protein